jgi:BirA family biotin operon repressor/biotin-[acetyl-CoA-carboxylase] ligase
MPCVTLAVGLGVTDAIAVLVPSLASRVRVKWPNDAWIDRKKTAGVLVESSSMGSTPGPIVIGIGLGVNRMAWDAELAPTATSLIASGMIDPLDRNLVLARLLLEVERSITALLREGPTAIARRLDARLALRGESVAIDDVRGELIGVTDHGALRLSTPGGERVFVSGTLRPT